MDGEYHCGERSKMSKITPHLWFHTDAEEAVRLYTSLIDGSSIGNVSRYGKEGFEVHHMPEGTVMTVSFTLAGQPFMALNGGPAFTFNPSISFHLKCKTEAEVDALWEKLISGGTALMELGSYPFSKRYGWLKDKYGVSWQIIHVGDAPMTQRITPVLMFVGPLAGKCEEAANFYVSLFKNSKVQMISRYGKGMEPDKENSVNYMSFVLDNTEFGAMDSAHKHNFAFNEAISFLVDCANQEEVDYFWQALTANGGEASMCGWLKDKYGVSWQIVPRQLGELLANPDPKVAGNVMKTMLSMKKIIISDLVKAADAT